jgi:glycosyltransferase involved in cell wall biosynthesis
LIRVAFLLGALDQGWLGGVNYYRGLIYALNSLPDRHIEPVIVTGSRPSDALVEALGDAELLRTDLLDRNSFKWLASKSWRTLTGKDPFLESFLLKHGIKVISHAPYIGRNKKLLTLGWIPDFQYKYLPNFFSQREREIRESNNRKICQNSDAVIASSYSARENLLEFAPYLDPNRAVVLQFTSGIRREQKIADIESLRQKYHFGEKYFLLPNQFWMHKNHRVALDALKLLKSHSQKVEILFTGNSHDLRNPEYFNELVAYAEVIGVKQDFRLLGVTPYDDLLGLMAHSIALINPSMFEGWSSTVEEAKALGKQLILSDIAVHREQARERVTFFPLYDANSLAQALILAWQSFDRPQENAYLAKALDNADERWKAYGMAYQGLIEQLVKNHTYA